MERKVRGVPGSPAALKKKDESPAGKLEDESEGRKVPENVRRTEPFVRRPGTYDDRNIIYASSIHVMIQSTNNGRRSPGWLARCREDVERDRDDEISEVALHPCFLRLSWAASPELEVDIHWARI